MQLFIIKYLYMTFSCAVRTGAACTGSYSEWACLCFRGLIWWRRNRSDVSWMLHDSGLTLILLGGGSRPHFCLCWVHLGVCFRNNLEDLFLLDPGLLVAHILSGFFCTNGHFHNGFLHVFFFFQCSFAVYFLSGVSPLSRDSSSIWLYFLAFRGWLV